MWFLSECNLPGVHGREFQSLSKFEGRRTKMLLLEHGPTDFLSLGLVILGRSPDGMRPTHAGKGDLFDLVY